MGELNELYKKQMIINRTKKLARFGEVPKKKNISSWFAEQRVNGDYCFATKLFFFRCEVSEDGNDRFFKIRKDGTEIRVAVQSMKIDCSNSMRQQTIRIITRREYDNEKIVF